VVLFFKKIRLKHAPLKALPFGEGLGGAKKLNMKNLLYIASSLFIFALLLGSGTAEAQNDTIKLKQEVEVTKAYQPTINEALKINDIPQVKAEPTETPTFDYSIYSKPVFSTFDVKPVAAAKMVGETKPEMELGLLKLGLGNYLTPYGELFFNSQPDKKSNFGMHFSHLSSSGKIKLLNDDKVKAPESVNTAEIFGKHFFRKSTLSGNLSFDRKAFTYYGYTGDLFTETEKDQIIPLWGDKQYFSKGTADVHLKTETLAAYDLNYDFGMNYQLMKSKTGQTENRLVLSGDLKKKFGNAFGQLNTSLTYYTVDSIQKTSSVGFGKKNQMMIRANPSVRMVTDNSSLQIGLNSTMFFDKDASAKFLVYPKVKAEWSPVERILTLFAGVDSYLQHNTYSGIASENPYVDPYHDVKSALYEYVLSGGFKGKLSPKTNYVAEVNYSTVKDQHFYYSEGMDIYTPTSSFRRLNNTFNLIYDDVNILKLSGEVLHSVSDNFSFHLIGNYYSYDLKTQKKAWQMPNFDLTISGVYKPTEQLKFTTDIFVIGNRTALIDYFDSSSIFDPGVWSTQKEVAMDPIIDLNVGAEYQFSPKLNFFVKLNNFGFQQYEQWLGYTSKSFNWLAGISYSF
jgi:hypothetical protein